MNISKIELQDFRQYKGNVKLKFDTDSKKNIAVVLGVNGAGKSNLYNAITWCLYGVEEHSKYRAGALKKLNESKREAMADEDYADVKVSLTFDGKTPMRIERTQTYVKSANGFLVEHSSDVHKVWFYQDGNWKQSSQPSATVNAMLPEGIRKFFFFDGERLDDFFKPGLEGKDKIREAIHDVSGVDIIDKTADHLAVVEKKIRKDAGKMGSEKIQIIEKKMNDLSVDMTGREDIIAKKQKNISFLEIEIENIATQLKVYPVKDIKEYQNDREEIERDIKFLKNDLQENRLKKIGKIVDNGPYIFAMGAYDSSRKIIDKATEKGQLPPPIRGSFVRELLDDGQCICGMDIAHKGPHRKKIEGYLRDSKWSSQIDEQALNLKWKFETRTAAVATTSTELAEIGMKITDIENKIENKQMKLKEISEKLKNYDSKEIVELEGKRASFDRQVSDNKMDLAVYKNKQEEDKKYMKDLKDDYNKELRKSQQFNTIREKLDFATKALEILSNIKDEYISEVREKISSNTDAYFKELIWKKKEYDKVDIDEDFDLQVFNKFGSNVKLDLSAGERQVLALSFMAALKDITGYKAPVLIDTPMGRISKEPKDNIAECLPKYLKDSQLILLVTDSEYTPSVKDKLDKRTASSYRLSFNENTSSTAVEVMA